MREIECNEISRTVEKLCIEANKNLPADIIDCVKNAKETGIIKECPNCGASIDSNNTGVCPYCRSVYNLKDYDWILTKIS